VLNCTPGQQVNLSFAIPQGAPPQVVRVCDSSSALATSIPCTYNGPYNAQSLANSIVVDLTSSKVSLTCPIPLDENEHGGKLSLYVAPLLPDDSAVPISYKIR